MDDNERETNEREEVYARVPDQLLLRVLLNDPDAWTKNGRLNYSGIARLTGIKNCLVKERVRAVLADLKTLCAGGRITGGSCNGGKAIVEIRRGWLAE